MAIILIVNWSVALLLSILSYLRHKRIRETIATFLLIAAFPGGGILLTVLLFYKSGQHADSPEEIQQQIDSIHRQSESYQFIPIFDEYEDYHVVPIEETLLIADYSERRKTVLGVLRRDASQYSHVINLAVRNDDSETAHYAASSLLHQKRKLDKQIIGIAKELEANPYDRDLLMAYADMVNDYIGISDPADGVAAVYREQSAEVLRSLVDLQEPVPVKYPVNLLSYLTSKHDWEAAARIESILKIRFPESEIRAIALLEYYFARQDIGRFNQTLHELRESNLILSPQLIDNMNFWAGEI